MTTLPPNWQTHVADVDAELRTWSLAHPQATLTEIEHAVDQHVRRLRAELIVDLAGAVSAVPVCPDCGQPLRAAGTRERTVVTQGAEPLTLTRAYATCSACGTGLFPPG